MIETEHTIVVCADINNVWGYVKNIGNWAVLFPGCRKCNIIDDNNSKWMIKVGAGGLIKTVNVLVHVDQWAGPNRVDFSFQLESEPVMGTGTYTAAKKSDKETEIRLKVQVEGSGQAALMWEAVSRPLLPQMAKTFASKLRSEIECLESVVTEHPEKPHALNRLGRLRQWLRNMWRALLERC